MWRKQALDELALVWMATADRPRLSDAVRRIDATLRLNPEIKGVDFYGDRLLVVAPLAVVFMIREEDRIAAQTAVSPTSATCSRGIRQPTGAAWAAAESPRDQG